MLFITKSNSIYELDRNNNRIRQLNSKESSNLRKKLYEEWQDFISCSEVRIGHRVLIQWDNIRVTLTSIVICIDPLSY